MKNTVTPSFWETDFLIYLATKLSVDVELNIES